MTHTSTIPGNHFKQVCQYGYVHSQCRCPSPEKQEVTVECNRLNEHAPSKSSGSLVSLKHSSFALIAPQLSASDLMLSYDSPNALARAANHLLSCGHAHTFIVLAENRPLAGLVTSREAVDCLRLASLMF